MTKMRKKVDVGYVGNMMNFFIGKVFNLFWFGMILIVAFVLLYR
jgi:hypothetical protein